MTKPFTPYANKHYESIGLTVLKRVADATRFRDSRNRVRYQVQHDCCGRMEELSHGAITRRLAGCGAKCRKCTCKSLIGRAGAGSGLQNYGVTPPAWPVPGD